MVVCVMLPERHSIRRTLANAVAQRTCINSSVIHRSTCFRRPGLPKPIRSCLPPFQRSFSTSIPWLAPSSDKKSGTSTGSSNYDSLKQTQSSASSLLDTHVNRAAASAKIGAGRPGSDGTFYLGIRPGEKELPKGYKTWKQLGVGGKVARTGARATSTLVILAGAGLTALLIYALATELGSRNSPTVIYADVCDIVREHEGLRQFFPPSSTLKFHTTRPQRYAEQRPRHRNRSVPSAMAVDARGREHLYLNFWIEALTETAPTWRNLAYWNVFEWNWDLREWDWSIAQARAWLAETRHELWTKGRELLAFLSGEQLARDGKGSVYPKESPHSNQIQSIAIQPQSTASSQPKNQSLWSSLTGLFSSIRPMSNALSKAQARKEPKVFTSGEVHVDLIRDSSNNYHYRYILIDLPNSTGSAPTRVFVKRTAGVAEDESVMRFS